MPYSRRSSYSSRSRSPYHSESVFRSRSRSRSLSPDAENPGNNLYVTGLSSRATKRDIEKHFSHEGEVVDVHLVVDPWTKESRGFGFVTMANVEDANRCLKYLDRSVLEGRVITVEKAKRGRGRTPTPGRYLGSRSAYECHRSPSYSPYRRDRYDSPGYSSDIDLQRRSYSRSRSPCDLHDRSPDPRHRQRSYSPADSRSWLPHGHRRLHARSISPRRRRSKRSYSRSVSLSRSRSYSRSISPISRRRSRRSYSRSYSPRPRKRSMDRSRSSRRSRRYSRESYSHSRSRGLSSHSPSISRSRSP